MKKPFSQYGILTNVQGSLLRLLPICTIRSVRITFNLTNFGLRIFSSVTLNGIILSMTCYILISVRWSVVSILKEGLNYTDTPAIVLKFAER